MNSDNRYKFFNKFILRTPLFPYSTLDAIISKRNIREEDLKQICSNPSFQEAIFLASPELSAEVSKWLNKELSGKSQKAIEKLHFAVLKYLIRMSTRCTPFGLFAGFSVGHYGSENNIKTPDRSTFKRHTRLDMNYLCSLIQDISQIPELRETTKYYPNNSIYSVGNQLRYIEYHYEYSRRFHQIVAVDYSEYLKKILRKSSNGAYIDDLATVLVNDEIEFEEAKEFVNELIDGQLLVNEFEPSITGKEFLDQILQILENINSSSKLKEVLIQIKKKLDEIDSNAIGTTLSKYHEIANNLNSLETKYDIKFLFQTDMIIPSQNFTLSKDIPVQVLQGIEALNKLTLPPPTTYLKQFKEAFYERYEDREMPLLHVLDTEVGIGYMQNNNSGDVSLLADNIFLPNLTRNHTSINWTDIHSFLLKKITQAISQSKLSIEIKEDELKSFNSNWDDMPDTFSTMVNIFENGKIYMKEAGGSSSTNLLGRFCHADGELYNYVKEIKAKEEELNPDKILAEIVHLPESRVGNILLRPVLGEYEIPYLAKSSVKKENRIELQDLMISVKRNRVVLRSKKLNKEIIPRLSTAHNYTSNALPVYQFLCDMQNQEIRSVVGFNWRRFEIEYPFLPRIEYKNLILSLATWNIKKEDIDDILNANSDDELYKQMENFKLERKLPDLVTLVDGDNKLLINLKNLLCIKTLIATIKNRKNFILTEFLFNAKDGIAKGPEGIFTNQFIISFYKTTKQN